MVAYPVREVDCGLVVLSNCKLRVLLWFICNGRHERSVRNRNTRPPEIVCNAPDLEINIVHFAKLLWCLLVVALRLGIEFNPVVTVLTLTRSAPVGRVVDQD
jgi:hypothetical protein